MIALYGSSLWATGGRRLYPPAPADRSRSSWPVSTQEWIVRRFTPNRLDSSVFETPRSK